MNLLPLPLESLPALCRARFMIKIAIVVACGGLCSSAPAVNPAPDGGYPGRSLRTARGATRGNRPATFAVDADEDEVRAGNMTPLFIVLLVALVFPPLARRFRR
jgi:hypothetical protein